MKQKITQMRLIRYLFTAVLALLFISCSKGRSSDEPKPNNGNGEQTTSSKQVEDEIGFGQREVTLQVGETVKVTLHGARSPRIETSSSNLVEVTLVEQGTAVSLKGLQAGEGAIKVFLGNRYAELRVVVKATDANPNNSFNGKDIVWDKISRKDYMLTIDDLTLIIWENNNTKNLDMNRDPLLKKIKNIRPFAFSSCINLTNITIPNSVTSIGWFAFSGCKNLTSINIPISVTSIEFSTFANCSSLKSINIPNSVTNIGKSAFYDCSSLTSVTIPSSVTRIEELTFSSCRNLTNVNIPNSVTSIEFSAFENCSSLKSITIPSSVTSIKMSAFRDCSSLKSITIPSSITSIGERAFSGCSSLTSVDIPNSVTRIEAGAFRGCSSLASITIPSSVTSIEAGAFRECRNLTHVVFKGNNPPENNSFDIIFGWRSTSGIKTIVVPKGAKSAYIEAGYPKNKIVEQ